MQTIFVQIASYRDEELSRTILSALGQAHSPERIHFGICWQYDENTYTDLDPFIRDSRFRISQTYYEGSKGCCWARNQTNLLYLEEDFTLQIDAHTRFAKDWDSLYIEMLESLPCEKPLLSTYPSPFLQIHGQDKLQHNGIQRLILNRMAKDLTTVFKSEPVEDKTQLAPSKFIGAGQIFTLGKFCREVEYDPYMYFHGEEISLSARAYTQGYDFFCPNRDLIWHLYQHHMPTHWADHNKTQHTEAVVRLGTLLAGNHTTLGKYGLGKQRTLEQFEEYAELDFADRMNSVDKDVHFQKTIDINVEKIPRRDDYHLWIFTLNNAAGDEIYRRDIVDSTILQMTSNEIVIDEDLAGEPVSYMLWPKTWGEGFLEKQLFDL
ncbi:MAG: hypothetical protein ACI8P9_001993 [Parasphingorhabdus sp.]|jgi:hypothetical protein